MHIKAEAALLLLTCVFGKGDFQSTMAVIRFVGCLQEKSHLFHLTLEHPQGCMRENGIPVALTAPAFPTNWPDLLSVSKIHYPFLS